MVVARATATAAAARGAAARVVPIVGVVVGAGPVVLAGFVSGVGVGFIRGASGGIRAVTGVLRAVSRIIALSAGAATATATSTTATAAAIAALVSLRRVAVVRIIRVVRIIGIIGIIGIVRIVRVVRIIRVVVVGFVVVGFVFVLVLVLASGDGLGQLVEVGLTVLRGDLERVCHDGAAGLGCILCQLQGRGDAVHLWLGIALGCAVMLSERGCGGSRGTAPTRGPLFRGRLLRCGRLGHNRGIFAGGDLCAQRVECCCNISASACFIAFGGGLGGGCGTGGATSACRRPCFGCGLLLGRCLVIARGGGGD